MDLAIVFDNGELVYHRANCPEARKAANDGKPVLTTLGCERMPADCRRHRCLLENQPWSDWAS